MAIDVHPRIAATVRDPKVALFITEGVKKADAAISACLCCIALIGAWNFRGTNEHCGKSALPDWEFIAPKDRNDVGRTVYICYDSDVMVKPQVHQALTRLSDMLKLKGTRVLYIYLPYGSDGSKHGLDDYLAQGHGVDALMSLASAELRMPSDESAAAGDDTTHSDSDTVSQRLMALASDALFFRSERGEPYARYRAGDHFEVRALGSEKFEQWLGLAYYTAYGKPASKSAIDDAIFLLCGKASYEGPELPLAVRAARGTLISGAENSDDSIFIDMPDDR